MNPTLSAPPAELRRIQLRSRRLVTGDLLGQYRSAFRGSGLVFSDLREYQPGDDIKHIHWKATARTGTVFIKSYEEDRQLRVVLGVDTSASMRAVIGQQAFQKSLEFCSLIASLTQRGNDQLGALLFSEGLGKFIPPKASPKQAARVLSAVTNAGIDNSSSTNISQALDHFGQVMRKPSIIFLVSDFECPDFTQSLRRAAARHDIVLVQVQPPLTSLPSLGIVSFRDAESGELCVVDTGSAAVQRAWAVALKQRRAAIKEVARSCGADHIVITDSCAKPLLHLMMERVRRIAR